MKLRHIFATISLTVFAALVPSAASSHAALSDSIPKDGAVLTELPQQVTVSLNERVREPAQLAVINADGNRINSKTVTVADNTASSQIVNRPGSGDYTMSYRVVSADGHPVTGTIKFTVEAPTSPSPSDPDTSTETSPSPVPSPTPTISPDLEASSTDSPTTSAVVAVVLLALLVIAVVVLFTRGPRDEESPRRE